MKRTNVLPMGAMSLLLAFSACTDVYVVQNGELNRIVMTASDFEVESESRTNFKITTRPALKAHSFRGGMKTQTEEVGTIFSWSFKNY